MTLSRWLRDYLYVSLGGNRISRRMTYRNLLITMTLGGLWHGAAWTFVLWGMWHGAWLAIERYLTSMGSRRLSRLVGWLTTMLIVIVGWVLFRSSPDLSKAVAILWQIASFRSGILWCPPLVLGALGCMIAEHLAWRTKLRRAMRLPFDAWYSPIGTAIMIWALLLYAPRGFRPFVYFQF